jgi:hypothetical protein
MFVDKSALPDNSAMEFTPPDIGADTSGPGDPPDPPKCAPLFWGPAHTQMGGVSWSTRKPANTLATSRTEGKFFNLFLAVPTEHPDLNSLLRQCGTITAQGMTVKVEPLLLPGLPNWAVATRITLKQADGVGIIGLCRGLYVSVAFNQLPSSDISPKDTNALVKVFNDQVAKLEAI